MKSLFSLLLVSMMGFSAQAKTVYGSQCGLIDEADYFELWYETSFDLNADAKLDAIQGMQVKATVPGKTTHMSAEEAQAYLIDISELGAAVIETGKYHGQYYDVVRYFPGGNPYGAIFKRGSADPIAFIADSDIICAPSK